VGWLLIEPSLPNARQSHRSRDSPMPHSDQAAGTLDRVRG
jgi:hypothetical protein